MRILSYNIHKGIGGRDRRYSLERIFAVIEAEAPDVICLQEVDRNVPRSRSHDQPQLFVEGFCRPDTCFSSTSRLNKEATGTCCFPAGR